MQSIGHRIRMVLVGREIKVLIARDGAGFQVRVQDDGPGVAIEDEDRIFESYVSTKPNGMGLGLYIARLVIEPYGRLVYDRDSGLNGACFVAKFEQG